MNIENFDWKLLICFERLRRERKVSRAAEQLNISQPAMSQSLKRLRSLLDDPLFVRTTQGMQPTERALQLEPLVRQSLVLAEQALSPVESFDYAQSDIVFRLLVSDYVEGALITTLVQYLQEHAPMISLDVLTLSDGDFQDLEKGKIDLAINRFDYIPQSFHHRVLWSDSYVCMVNKAHPLVKNNTLEQYLESRHIWVSKTGVGVGTGMSQDNVRKLGWVDGALKSIGLERNIKVFTRHYQIIPLLLQESDLVATIPIQAARSYATNDDLTVIPAPFTMTPYDVKMVWSPIVHHRSAHQWLRNTLFTLAKSSLSANDMAPAV